MPLLITWGLARSVPIGTLSGNGAGPRDSRGPYRPGFHIPQATDDVLEPGRGGREGRWHELGGAKAGERRLGAQGLPCG